MNTDHKMQLDHPCNITTRILGSGHLGPSEGATGSPYYIINFDDERDDIISSEKTDDLWDIWKTKRQRLDNENATMMRMHDLDDQKFFSPPLHDK